ncbi:MAG: hypothetical protein QOK37_12 [Thermoanaerobaculia bacterium]|nr:hypothetical protein [Thermoanaerobaculia bacterium]
MLTLLDEQQRYVGNRFDLQRHALHEEHGEVQQHTRAQDGAGSVPYLDDKIEDVLHDYPLETRCVSAALTFGPASPVLVPIPRLVTREILEIR